MITMGRAKAWERAGWKPRSDAVRNLDLIQEP
jgi:hypothetical protein